MSKKYNVLFIVFFSLIFFGLSVKPSLASSYFVSQSGCSDSNSGSVSQPFCTVGKALNLAVGGDSVFLRSGTYPGFEVTKSGSSAAPITIKSYNNEHVTINGPSNTIRLSGVTNVIISGFEITGGNASYGGGIFIKGGSSNQIIGNEVHNNLGSKTQGIVLESSNNNVISRNIVYRNYSVGIKIRGISSGNQITENTVHDHSGDPGNSDGISVTDQTSVNTLIKNNTVYNNSDDGIDTWDSNHQTIIGNRSYGNGLGGGDGNGFKMGGTGTGGSNLVIGNISYNNKRDGFDSNHSGNNTYINNIAFNNGSVGFEDGEGKLSPCTPSSCKTTYINNISYNNSSRNFNASEFTAVSHNNIWFSDGGNPNIAYKGSQATNLLAFYNASGNRLDNPNAGALSSKSVNPLFVSAGAGGFNLSSNSPAINAGDPSNPGNISVNGISDIGAIEYGGVVSSPPTSTPILIKTGDVNSDGNIDIIDIGIVIDNYAKLQITNSRADVNHDGKVDIIDIGIEIDNYGK